MKISLNSMDINKKGKVIEVNNDNSIKRRLLDIGFTKGTIIEKTLKNYGGNLCAYLVRGALIAIRNDDAKNIIVEVLDE
ncbi:MAG: FeoA family protein [bacterium]|nr:FeoA family protein [bacterium]